jgi:hypothetical protein
MSWTVACFCGNNYTAPPERCGACGRTLPNTAPRRAPTRRRANAAALCRLVPEVGLRAHDTHGSKSAREALVRRAASGAAEGREQVFARPLAPATLDRA